MVTLQSVKTSIAAELQQKEYMLKWPSEIWKEQSYFQYVFIPQLLNWMLDSVSRLCATWCVLATVCSLMFVAKTSFKSSSIVCINDCMSKQTIDRACRRGRYDQNNQAS